ncbi:MAG: hypothetical protein ACM3UZ_06995 [Acidobacteriota bacterium]
MNMGYTSSIGLSGGFVGGLLILLTKLLAIVLVVSIIAGILVWLNNSFFTDEGTSEENSVLQSINNDPTLRTLLTVVLAVVAIALILTMVNSGSRPGFALLFGLSGWAGYNAGFGLVGLLTLLVKLLAIFIVGSLILAVVNYIKDRSPSEVCCSVNKATLEKQSSIAIGSTVPTSRDPEPPAIIGE